MIICKYFLRKFVFIQYLANRLHPNYSLFDTLCKSFLQNICKKKRYLQTLFLNMLFTLNQMFL
ncbi:MAG TPA: hypothetical protein DIT57_12615 [Enterococcus sp.]|nr:hypothetical protein [Enterococcus sp.]